MAGRIRSLKPELLDDESNAKLSDAAWRLWVSMRLLADDHGNVRAGDRYLAANVWQDTGRTVDEARAELARVGKIAPYTVHGERFAHLNGWEGEQRIDNAGKPRVPGPNEDDGAENQEVSCVFAEARGDSPRLSEKFGSRDAGARASSPPDQRSPISDLRPPSPRRASPPRTAARTPPRRKHPRPAQARASRQTGR